MFSPRPLPVITLLLHTLCQLHLVFCQSNTTADAPTASSTIANNTVTQPLLWNFTYPNTVFESVLLVSPKDTIRASWTSLPANETTILQIHCWNRNGTTTPIWFTKPPDFSSNITTLPAFSYIDHFDVPITPYKAYDPCTFLLLNTLYGNATHAISGTFGINDTAGKDGQTWALDHPAPMGNIMDSFHGSSAATARLSWGAIMRLIGLTCVNVMMVGKIL